MQTKKRTISEKNRKKPNKTAKRGKQSQNVVSRFITVLTKKYPNCVFDKKNHEDEYSHPITYGEVTYEGMETLQQLVLTKFLKSPTPVVFIDIGMGRGKLPLYMSSNPRVVESFGVELVKERYDDAVRLKNTVAKGGSGFSKFIDKVKFINGDVLNDETTKNIHKSNPCFIWMSNLCFGPSLTNKIFNKLHGMLHHDSIICCSTAPPNQPKFELVDTINIPMSWSQESNVHIFGFRR
jgi:hypothetical protein